MSRIGKQPVEIPSGVDVVVDGQRVAVTGPRGSLEQTFHPEVRITKDDGTIVLERTAEDGFHRGLHGLTRTLIANMVVGVTQGYEKRLEVVGVGYRAVLKGSDLELALGFSHPVHVQAPKGIEFEVPTPTRITIRGIDKQLVGEVAANIRKVRKPEPYKGKGVRYEGEFVRKKAGKAAKGGK
jgi:large subunit ribosomal protein L6